MSVNLGAPEYAALAFLFTGGLITASLEPLGKLRDVVLLRCSAAHRTYALLDNFNFLQETLERQRHWSYQMVKAPPGVKIRFERLVYKLDALDIPRNGPRKLDSAVSEILHGIQAAKLRLA